MKLVAMVRAPAKPEEAASSLGNALGLTLAEARMRLAPEPPTVLALLAPAPADALVSKLRGAGMAVLSVDAAVPSDSERTVARTVALGPTGATFQPRSGAPVELPWGEVVAILRGVSAVRTEMSSVQESKKFSLATAIATQGLKTSQTVEKTVRSHQEQVEQVILVYGRGGQRISLREQGIDYSCLGAAMQPTRTANIAVLARLLKEKTPGAFHDERLIRLGRRPLPMFIGGEVRTSRPSQTSVETAGGLDVLAEILWRAVEQGLLSPT
ncbi:hypothetical protein [Hyalangium rubrum]|uniref:Uncharacterized protein n=1 Tax=Hyalangium rubrum TaxID=3103134 RepID=A0ABU5H770_9BACT|nr:hypothetical protein [Hyalangium sp. s54d21]MDY7229328.1 hypothetical protein [Hyalangium sp. s54d21]